MKKSTVCNGNLIITKENESHYTYLTEVSGSIYIRQGATFTAPALTKSGYIDISEGATFTAPALTEVSGYIYIRQGATVNTPHTKNLNYKSVDRTLFVIESENTSKGIKIYSGYVIESIKDNKPIKRVCFVSEKDGFYAHGETIKQSISDLQFKIVAEKLKNDPINPDTIVSINHYRTVTGACELGVKSWIEANSIKVDKMRADELLPLLRKTHAYGLERFEKLITF